MNRYTPFNGQVLFAGVAVDVQRLPATILGHLDTIASGCPSQLHFLCSDTLQRAEISAPATAGHHFWLGIRWLQKPGITRCPACPVQYLHFWASCFPGIGLVT